MARLTEAGILRETTGRQRGRLFAYGRYIDILNTYPEPRDRAFAAMTRRWARCPGGQGMARAGQRMSGGRV